MKIHIPAFTAMAKCNQHMDHGPIDIDLGPDVVQVVRCKDCTHAYINSFSAAAGMALCKLLTNRSDGGTVVMRQDAYCSYGERKEGDGNG